MCGLSQDSEDSSVHFTYLKNLNFQKQNNKIKLKLKT